MRPSPVLSDPATAPRATPAARRPAPQDRTITAAVAALTLAVYVRSLLPGVGYSGDTAKWQILSELGGTPHATGYPLYVGLIQAFGWVVPFGSAAWRTNLFSALCAAAAVAVLYRLLRLLGLRWEVAATTASTFAFTTAFWTQAVVAEVYTLHLLFMVAILACLARWRLAAGTKGGDGWLLAVLALIALSFGNHLTTMLVLPGVAWVLWSDWRRALTLRHLMWVALAAVVAAGQYLYLVYMADVGGYVESPVDTLDDIVRMVTGGPFRDQMLAFTPAELLGDRVPMLLKMARDEYRILLVPVVIGAVRWLRGLRAAGDPASRGRNDIVVAVALLGLGSAVYGLNYDVPDVIVYFLPLFLALAVFLGLGLDGIVDWVGARFSTSRPAALGLAGALLALPLVTGLVNYRHASQRGNIVDQQRIERALAGAGEHAVLLTDSYHDSEYFWYFLLVEGRGASQDLALDYIVSDAGPVVAATRQGRAFQPPAAADLQPQAEAMADAGLTVAPHAPGLWRITRGTG